MKDGGPAFPVGYFYDDKTYFEIMPSVGISLRDYFAAAALQGLMDGWLCTSKDDGITHLHFAQSAYMFADAMLKQREEVNG
jgi:hypothetical protein